MYSIDPVMGGNLVLIHFFMVAPSSAGCGESVVLPVAAGDMANEAGLVAGAAHDRDVFPVCRLLCEGRFFIDR
ncbi:hypothetical protein [Dechloromonas denitrificans]|uniref:hypothetical protein n=1 Tax=Dechloromonas denitrificans TaxID=281362 RepID=UPI001CF901FD|nr:hypothetical protein [Dechloromonas denitrificans]UCV05024.1 hypothetical protein KI611_07175 [Dechloromonas denitrificans]